MHDDIYLHVRKSDEAEDRDSAPATAEGAQVLIGDWMLALIVLVMVACGIAAALLN